MAGKKAESKKITEPPKPDVAAVKAKTYKRYVIKHLMNRRKQPSLKAVVLGTVKRGSVVEAVLEVGWLHLKDGAFVLFGDEYAEEENI